MSMKGQAMRLRNGEMNECSETRGTSGTGLEALCNVQRKEDHQEGRIHATSTLPGLHSENEGVGLIVIERENWREDRGG